MEPLKWPQGRTEGSQDDLWDFMITHPIAGEKFQCVDQSGGLTDRKTMPSPERHHSLKCIPVTEDFMLFCLFLLIYWIISHQNPLKIKQLEKEKSLFSQTDLNSCSLHAHDPL